MKHRLSQVSVMVMCLALVIGIACGGGGDEKEEGVNKLKFGTGLCYAGAGGAVAGMPWNWAMDLTGELIGEFEVGGERYVWDFITEENYVNISGGIASANKLIYESGVRFMYQGGADAATAAAPICNENEVIMFGGALSMDAFLPEWDYCWEIMQIYDLEWQAFWDWLSKEHPEVKRVAQTHGEDRMGMAMYDGAKAGCEYWGLELETAISAAATVEWYPIATKLMAFKPDLVIGGIDLFKTMWDMGYEGICVSYYWSEAGVGQIPWDKAAGKLLIIGAHPVVDQWPEVTAFMTEYVDRYGVEVNPAQLLPLVMMTMLTEAIVEAGTVEDTHRIVEIMETRTFDTQVGPVHFGGEELTGNSHLLIWPFPILEVVGLSEYEVLKIYTPDEVEAIAIEVWSTLEPER